MKTSFRELLLGATIAFVLTLTLTALAQENQKAEPAAPPPAPAPAAPVAPAAPDAPVAPATPVPAPEAATAPAPAPTVEVEKPAEGEKPLRRLDVPAEGASPKGKKSTPARRTREPRSRASGGEAPFGDHTVALGAHAREAVSLFGVTTIDGEIDSDAVSILGRTTVGPEGKVGGAAVAVLGPLESKGRINGEAVSVFGGVEVDGPVKGEVVSVFGDMRLGPKAVVEGDIVLVGGKLTKDPQAVVRGNQVAVPIFGSIGDITWLTTYVKRCVFLARPLAFGAHLGWAWLVALSFLGFYALLALLFRGGIEKCVTTFETRPGMSLLSAVLTVMLSPVVIVLLIATVVGLVIVPFLAIGLVFAGLFGKAVMLAWVGRRFTRFFGDGPLAHPVFAVLIGGALVLLLYTVPVFGFLLYKLLGWLGLGVVVLAMAQAMKREKPATPATSAPIGGASGGEPLVIPTASLVVPATIPPIATGFGAPPVADNAEAGASSAAMGFAAGAAPAVATPLPPVAVPPPVVPPVGRPAAAPLVSASALPRAGLMIRLGALAIDGVLIGMIMGFLSGLLPRFLQFHSGPGGVLIVLAAYGAVMWKHKGTTIGGIVCGLKVVRTDDREIDWATAIVRALGCFLSLCVAGLGFLWVAFDDEKQSWHDKIAGTVVVRLPKGVSLL